jgi:hypothetical protein
MTVADAGLLQIKGQDARLIALLCDPLTQALADRRSVYMIEVDTVGATGQVLICISGSRGRLPLLFRRVELEPGHVTRVVRDGVVRLGL